MRKWIGPDEIGVGVALLLIAGGCWLMPSWHGVGVLVPGLVVLWLALPPRAPFIATSLVSKPTRRPE